MITSCLGSQCTFYDILERIIRTDRRTNRIQTWRHEGLDLRGGIVSSKDPKLKLLCSLNISAYCSERHIAEVTELMYAIEPIYSTREDQEEHMYVHHAHFVGYLKSIGITVVVIEGIYPQLGQYFRATNLSQF